MPKAVPVLILSTLLCLCASLWGWSEVSRTHGLLDKQIALREAAEERTKNIQTQLRKVTINYDTSRMQLESALRDRPATATPRAVYDELCKRARCVPVESVPAPAD